MQNHQLRISDDLWNALEELGQDLSHKDGRGAHSPLIREMVSAGVKKWRLSPYVCPSARHVILVTREGHVFYRLTQTLKLNRQRERLPCFLEMKPEKRQYFLDCRPPGMDEAAWFRSRWLLNHFAAWHGEGMTGRPLDVHVDRKGMESKVADLYVDQGAGRVLTREVVVAIQDYVQWKVSKRGEDRVDLPVDLPTRNLEVFAIVDLDLYRASGISEDEVPNLGVEFRNRESARFEGEDLGSDPENPMKGEPGRFPAKAESDVPVKALQTLLVLQELEQRIDQITSTDSDHGRKLEESEAQAIKDAFRRPGRFLFYHLEWPSPCFGIEVCVRFEKPDRP